MAEFITQWWPYIVTVVAAIWAMVRFVAERRNKDRKADGPATVSATDNSIAVGTMSGGSISTSAPQIDRKEQDS